MQLYKDGESYGVTTTGASGDYSFIGLPAGVYTVTVTDDFGVLTGYAPTTFVTSLTGQAYTSADAAVMQPQTDDDYNKRSRTRSSCLPAATT